MAEAIHAHLPISALHPPYRPPPPPPTGEGPAPIERPLDTVSLAGVRPSAVDDSTGPGILPAIGDLPPLPEPPPPAPAADVREVFRVFAGSGRLIDLVI